VIYNAADVAECPEDCNDCELDDNNKPTCKKTGCFDEYFYAEDEQQCVGQFSANVLSGH